MNNYEKRLLEESVSNYMDYLYEKGEELEKLKDELTVTQEIDELINDCKLKRMKLGELIYKI